MGRFDHIIDWFKKRHDTLIDDLEPLQAGSRRVMEFDGSEWRDITPKMIRETVRRIEEIGIARQDLQSPQWKPAQFRFIFQRAKGIPFQWAKGSFINSLGHRAGVSFGPNFGPKLPRTRWYGADFVVLTALGNARKYGRSDTRQHPMRRL